MKPKQAKILGAVVAGALVVAVVMYMMRAPSGAAPVAAPVWQATLAAAGPLGASGLSGLSGPAARGEVRAAEQQDTLEKSFADVASTVLDRTGVDDRINPTMSTKNGGMLPILDVRGDYDALMPFEDARCDENGRWNQSSKQQSIRLGLIKDVMKRRVVVA